MPILAGVSFVVHDPRDGVRLHHEQLGQTHLRHGVLPVQPPHKAHFPRPEVGAALNVVGRIVKRRVLDAGDLLQVVRVHAKRCLAKMVDDVTRFDGRLETLVKHPVRELPPVVALVAPVAVEGRTLPDPARGFVAPVFDGIRGKMVFPVAVPADVAARLAFKTPVMPAGLRRPCLGRYGGLAPAPAPTVAVGNAGVLFPPRPVLFDASGYSVDDALQSGCPRSRC